MEITIKGRAHPVDDVSVVLKNFGIALAERDSLPYTLIVPRSQVRRDFEAYYNDYVEDAKTHGIDEDEYVDQSLHAMGFPPWSSLLKEHSSMACSFVSAVVYDFLNSIFPHIKGTRPQFYIRTVDSVTMGEEQLEMTGTVLHYRRQQLNRSALQPPDSASQI